ncbi:hypothetical protein Tco_0031243 [Tanacetum coccineum]
MTANVGILKTRKSISRLLEGFQQKPDISSFGQFSDLSDNRLESSLRQSGSIASPVDNEIVMDFENSQLYKPSVRKSFERIPAISGLGQFDDLWANRCERFFRQSGSIASPDDRPGSQNVHRCTLARSARRHLHAHGAPTQSTRRSDAVTAGFSSLGRSREVFLLTLVCGSRDALPSLVVPLVHLSLPLVSLFFQPRTYNLSTLPFRDSVQIVENDLVVKKFPENDLDVKKFLKNDFEVLTVQEKHPST